MKYPYAHLGGGMFFEAEDDGTVTLLLKEHGQLSSKTISRITVTRAVFDKAVAATWAALDIDKAKHILGPRVVDVAPQPVEPAPEPEPEPLPVVDVELEPDEKKPFKTRRKF